MRICAIRVGLSTTLANFNSSVLFRIGGLGNPLCFSKSGYKGWSTILNCIHKIKKWINPYKEKNIYTVKTKTRKSCPRSISSEYTIDSILLFTVDEFREEEKSETFQLASYEYF